MTMLADLPLFKNCQIHWKGMCYTIKDTPLSNVLASVIIKEQRIVEESVAMK
jgi:hypothetical protein